jgi:hypothetical protein
MKYGIHQDDVRRAKFLRRATTDELNELAHVAEHYRLSEHHDLIGDFFDAYPITEHPESANLYWLFGIMGDAGLKLSPENWNTVERHIKSLGRFGSFRLASGRVFAAKFLADDFGAEARLAIPALRRALKDEDLRVQVWAHYALAVIEGDWRTHDEAVREIYSQHDKKDEFGCHEDDVGGEAYEALEKLRELSDKGRKKKRGH